MTLTNAVQDAWNAIASDLAAAAEAGGESSIAVEDAADAISHHIRLEHPEVAFKFPELIKVVRKDLARGRRTISL